MPPMRPMQQMNTNEKADLGAIKKILVYCKRYLPAVIVALLRKLQNAFVQILMKK